MSNINKLTVLQLNASWMPIGQKTIKDAIIAMTSIGESPPCLAIDIEYALVDGEYDFSQPVYLNPIGWDQWIQLPVREYDISIRSAKLEIRAPTILIAPGYNKMPVVNRKFTNANIFERDGGICQYTGKKVPKNKGSVDHVVARSKGGANTWENVVWTDASVNSLKGDKSLSEMNLKLIRQPKTPMPMPKSASIREVRHRDWNHFLIQNKN